MLRVVVLTDRRLCGSEEIAGHVGAILDAVPRGSVGVQVREKDLDGGPLLRLVREVMDVTVPRGAPLWVNDRVDVALLAGAGVHLPERGMAIADARAVGATQIGCSRHDRDGVLAAGSAGAELVQLGPIWATPNKGAPIGVEPLAVRKTLAAPARLVAVGGVDGPARARLAALAGADAVAVIRAAWTPDAPRVIAAMVSAVEAAVSLR